jgi:hypothetical protein
VSGRWISLLVLITAAGGVAWIVWRSFFAPLLWNLQDQDQAPAEVPTLAIVPTIPAAIPEREVPKIPSYLVGPFVFVDARLGVAMLAGYPVRSGGIDEIEPWIFRVHGDGANGHWCCIREATINDLETIDNLKRYARPLLLLRAQ